MHGRSGTPSNMLLWAYPSHNPNSISNSSAVFAGFMAQCHRARLACALGSPLKISSSQRGSGPNLIDGSLSPQVHNPNSIWIGSTVFAQLMTVSLIRHVLRHVLSPKNCPYASRASGPYLIHASLSPFESLIQMTSRSVQPFLHTHRRVSSAILRHALPPQKTAPSHGGPGSI